MAEVDGGKMYMDPNRLPPSYVRTFQAYMLSGRWEEQTSRLFKETVREGDVVVDLGANIGFFTLLASRLVGDAGRVYAFEPEPTNYSLLLKNIELNGCANVVAVPKAVSDREGISVLALSRRDTGAHTLRRSGLKGEFGESIAVETITVDDYFRDREARVDVVKMDVEGAEACVFRGMRRVLGANSGVKLFVEFYPRAICEMGDSPEAFAQDLFRQGFKAVAIDDYSTRPESRRVERVDDLMTFVGTRTTVNLFLWRHAMSVIPPDPREVAGSAEDAA